MRALGIGLMVFNLLLTAAIALYFGPQSWKIRQELNAGVAKSYLAIKGLPIENDGKFDANASTQPVSFVGANGHVVTTVSTPFMQGYFNGADGQPVNSQKEELERAYSEFTSKLGEGTEVISNLAGSINDRGQYTPGILALMADSFDERQAVKDLIPNLRDNAKVTVSASELKKLLETEYAKIGSEANVYTKKMKIAKFLSMLYPQSNTWQKRVILVCGLEQYQNSLAAQTTIMESSNRLVSRLIEQDQNSFETNYFQLRKLSTEFSIAKSAQKTAESGAKIVQSDDDSTLQTLSTRKADREKELGDQKALVTKQLESNAALEKEISETQKKFNKLLESIAEFETKLEEAEKRR